MFSQTRRTTDRRAATELSAAELDTIMGGTPVAPVPHAPGVNGSQNLLVVIAIIAILIG